MSKGKFYTLVATLRELRRKKYGAQLFNYAKISITSKN
ncbi:hypothetical protein JCM19300_1634 [Algibacter lectus]|uniref:Uncharacterized protein n=1 Tax=Algibacter lectus TaxID=221126 RepID=A0A090VAI9_9FLAO|nr:hypothetical protein JCM19300_1634 [Algibacter lectus]